MKRPHDQFIRSCGQGPPVACIRSKLGACNTVAYLAIGICRNLEVEFRSAMLLIHAECSKVASQGRGSECIEQLCHGGDVFAIALSGDVQV